MKNLMIAAVLSLGTMTAFSQDDENAVEEAGTAVEQAADDTGDAVQSAADNTGDAVEQAADDTADYAEDKANDAKEAMSDQDSFKEVDKQEVPEAITTALEEAHPGATVDKASKNDQSQYKLEVTKEDGESAELYMDADGNMIDM